MVLKVMFAWCLLVIILLQEIAATPIPAKDPLSESALGEEISPEKDQLQPGDEVVEGDTILNKQESNLAQQDEIQENGDSVRGMKNNIKNYLWTDKKLYYDLSKHPHPKFIRAALKDLQEELAPNCIEFIESTEAPNRVVVSGGSGGCWSYEGMQGGEQKLNLHFSFFGTSCKTTGTVQHEFLHALGFFHTQMRSDRDKYITINTKNIEEGHKNFIKLNEDMVDHFGLTFDYKSVMMYPEDAFGKQGIFSKKKTIKTTDPNMQDEIGQRKGVDAEDVKMVRRAYGC